MEVYPDMSLSGGPCIFSDETFKDIFVMCYLQYSPYSAHLSSLRCPVSNAYRFVKFKIKDETPFWTQMYMSHMTRPETSVPFRCDFERFKTVGCSAIHVLIALVCQVGATAITFDDLSSIDTIQGPIPTLYRNLTWVNANFLNTSRFPGTGYTYALGSYSYIGWFLDAMTIRLPRANRTIQLNSFVMAAGWSNAVNATVIGYFFNTQLYSTVLTLNMTTLTRAVLNWSGLNRIVIIPSSEGAVDTGFDSLCITF